MYEPSGALVSNFRSGSSVRDVTVDDDRVYLLYPTRVEVYDLEGGWIRDWEACSEESDYCSLTVLSGMSLLRMRLIKKTFVCIRLKEAL